MSKLQIIEGSQGGFRIAWIIDGDEGLRLGERAPDAEHTAATRAARMVGERDEAPDRTLTWRTIGEARAALRAAKVAINELRSKKPWPAWAKQAIAAGWRAPKGWAP